MASQKKKSKRKRKKQRNVDEDEPQQMAAWEEDYTLTVKEIEEDAFGAISWKNERKEQIKRKKRLESTMTELRVEKGMIRYVYIILDCSHSMNKRDLKPNRMVVAQQMCETFIHEFFDQNPLSQLGLIIAHHKIAQKITDLGGNPSQQIETLHNITDHILSYEQQQAQKAANQQSNGSLSIDLVNGLSLQNALEVAKNSLSQIPIHGSREIILITSALSSIDPDDIFNTIKSLKTNKIRTNIISLSAELHILSLIAQCTSGTFNVAMNQSHFHDLLLNQVPPQPITSKHYQIGRQWIKMGFPQQKMNNYPSLCFCHEQFTYKGYYCPKCNSKQCELPTDCTVCGLALISSPHLVRSYHHIFPVPEFKEVKSQNETKEEEVLMRDDPKDRMTCFGCQTTLNVKKNLMERCQKCHNVFCIECNVFIHESLHNCPGCMSVVWDT
eukprot:243983_1